MPYLVRLADRALRDLENIYQSVATDESSHAFAWFNRFAEAIYSLERLPDRGAVTDKNRQVRHLLFGKKPHVYRIIYKGGKRDRIVDVLHIRHCARAPLRRLPLEV